MSKENEYGNPGYAGFHIDPDASAHELLNSAIEWQQYIHGIAAFIAELVHDADALKVRHVALALRTISSIAKLSVEATEQAHAQMCQEQLKMATSVAAGVSPFPKV